jgi:hypothetical protein
LTVRTVNTIIRFHAVMAQSIMSLHTELLGPIYQRRRPLCM